MWNNRHIIRFFPLLRSIKKIQSFDLLSCLQARSLRNLSVKIDEQVHSNADLSSAEQIDNKKRTHSVKMFEGKFITPGLTKSRLKSVKEISSIVVSSQEVSCVKMNSDCVLTNLITLPTPKITRTCRRTYFKALFPLKEYLAEADLNVIEYFNLPPKYELINTHIRSLSLVMIGMLETDLNNPKVVFACRRRMGKLFGLNVAKTESRECSKRLVSKIFTQQRWNDEEVTLPTHFITEHNDSLYYTERFRSKLKNSAMSVETSDAILQALGFWHYVRLKTSDTR